MLARGLPRKALQAVRQRCQGQGGAAAGAVAQPAAAAATLPLLLLLLRCLLGCAVRCAALRWACAGLEQAQRHESNECAVCC